MLCDAHGQAQLRGEEEATYSSLSEIQASALDCDVLSFFFFLFACMHAVSSSLQLSCSQSNTPRFYRAFALSFSGLLFAFDTHRNGRHQRNEVIVDGAAESL